MRKRGFKFTALGALASLLQGWADFLFEQAGGRLPLQQEPSDQRSVAAETPHIDLVQSAQSVSLEEGMESTAAAGPPAHWLARVGAVRLPAYSVSREQKELAAFPRKNESVNQHATVVPQKLAQENNYQGEHERRATLGRSAVPQSRILPPASIDNEATQVEQLVPVNKIGHEAHPPGREGRQREAERIHREETGVAAPSNGVAEWNREQWAASPTALVQSSIEPALHISTLGKVETSDAYLDPRHARDREPDIHSIPMVSHNFWPRISAGIHGDQSLYQPGEQIKVETRWPSLPDNMMDSNQDWELHLRAWQRQQRLDTEQRGSSWNG